jgi:acetyl esterase/lipase
LSGGNSRSSDAAVHSRRIQLTAHLTTVELQQPLPDRLSFALQLAKDTLKMYRLLNALSLLLTLIASSTAFSQATSNAKVAAVKPPAELKRPVPTIADFKYGDDSPRQVLDFWQAKSDKPTPLVLLIHSGGWQARDKKADFGDEDILPLLDAGISVAAINYRFIQQAMEQHIEPPVKACLYDAARALQTIRSKSKEWNLDSDRFGATGGSAGACTSLWLAFHDDLAKPDSDDPIERQSTRLTCAAVLAAQTSLDPIQVREWIPNAHYGGHAFGFAGPGRNRSDEFALLLKNRESVLPWIKEYSPIELVSHDDPPIYLAYPDQKQPPAKGQKEPDPTHSAMYGVGLAERLKAAGIEVELSYPGHEDNKYGSINNFLISKLTAR